MLLNDCTEIHMKENMRIYGMFVVGICLLLNSTFAGAQTLPTVETVLKEYATFEAEIMKKTETEMNLRWEKLIADLQALQANLTKAGDLNGALAVRDKFNALTSARSGVYLTVFSDPGNLKSFSKFKAGDTLLFRVTGRDDGREIWGTDVYTLDSLLALVAVHTGTLKHGEIGIVKVTFAPGQPKYAGSLKNGVNSKEWPSYDLSYKMESLAYISPLNFLPTLPCSYKTILK